MEKIQPLITSIPSKLEDINAILVKGTAISYFSAISLGRKSNDVCSTINKAVAVYEEGFRPSESEAQILLEAMMDVVALTESQLSLLADTKPVFDKLLGQKDTASLGIASAKLSEAMSRVAPEHMEAQSRALEGRRRVAFERVLAVYGNGNGNANANGKEEGEGDGVMEEQVV